MLSKKKKLKLFFKSGNSIEVTCKEYTFRWERATLEFTGYEFKDMSPFVSFVPSQLEAYSVEN